LQRKQIAAEYLFPAVIVTTFAYALLESCGVNLALHAIACLLLLCLLSYNRWSSGAVLRRRTSFS